MMVPGKYPAVEEWLVANGMFVPLSQTGPCMAGSGVILAES